MSKLLKDIYYQNNIVVSGLGNNDYNNFKSADHYVHSTTTAFSLFEQNLLLKNNKKIEKNNDYDYDSMSFEEEKEYAENGDDGESMVIKYKTRNVITIIAYATIMIVSLIGNSLVCYVIQSTPKLRTTTNILIYSLTISDLMTTILNIPFNCARFLLRDWPFPDSFCIIMPTVQVTSVYVSTLTMASICLHRYRSILGYRAQTMIISSRVGFNHTACSIARIKIKMWILFIWFISILFALPHSFFNVVVWRLMPNGDMVRRCRAEYPHSIKDQMPLFLSLFATITQFLLPLCFVTVLYAKIGRIIADQGQLANHFCDELNKRMLEAKHKRITMLILIVAGFLFTWLPLTLYHLIIDFHLIHHNWNVFLALHIWAMTSVCYNSFIYFLMNEDFRKRLKQILTQKSLLPTYICCFFMPNQYNRNSANINLRTANQVQDSDPADDQRSTFSTVSYSLKQFTHNVQ